MLCGVQHKHTSLLCRHLVVCMAAHTPRRWHPSRLSLLTSWLRWSRQLPSLLMFRVCCAGVLLIQPIVLPTQCLLLNPQPGVVVSQVCQPAYDCPGNCAQSFAGATYMMNVLRESQQQNCPAVALYLLLTTKLLTSTGTQHVHLDKAKRLRPVTCCDAIWWGCTSRSRR